MTRFDNDTVDAHESVQDAVAARDGKVVFAGSDGDAKRYIGGSTKVVDLKGKMMLPGRQDAHVHPRAGGVGLAGCNLDRAALTIDETLETIQACGFRVSSESGSERASGRHDR